MEIDFPRIAVRLAVLIVLVGIWFVSRRRARRQVVVLGAEAAEAAARESLHRQQFADVPPPLPRWEYPRGAQALIDPQVLDLDRELRSICASLAESSPEARQDFRNAATADDFYVLLTFAKRASVFALRERDEGWVRDALTAVALVDAARVDGRDVSSGSASFITQPSDSGNSRQRCLPPLPRWRRLRHPSSSKDSRGGAGRTRTWRPGASRRSRARTARDS